VGGGEEVSGGKIGGGEERLNRGEERGKRREKRVGEGRGDERGRFNERVMDKSGVEWR
jgi:hypothetical protein